MATTPPLGDDAESDEIPGDEALLRGHVDPDKLLRAGLITELIVDLHKLADLAVTIGQGLAATNVRVEELADLRRRNRVLGWVLLGLAFVVLAAVLVLAVVLAFVLPRVVDAADASAAGNRVLIECTTPAPTTGRAMDDEDVVHECYDRNLVAQAQAVGLVGEDTLDAAICARTEADVARIADCFRARRAARAAATNP